MVVIGCAVNPPEGADFPEHAFEFSVYYDGRCEGYVTPDGKTKKSVQGVVSGTFWLDDSWFVFCDFVYRDGIPYVVNDLLVSIKTNQKMDRKEFLSKAATLKTSVGDRQVFQAKNNLVLRFSKYSRSPRNPTNEHPQLPVLYIAQLNGERVGDLFKKPEILNCGFDLYSKTGELTIYGSKDPNADRIYMSMTGKATLGGTRCF